MRSRRALTSLLALALLASMGTPAIGAAAPIETPPTFMSESFETTPSPNYTVGPRYIDHTADGNRFWGRITNSKASGSFGLWCSGSPVSSWPNYTARSSGVATFSAPVFAEYYAPRLDFSYTMPTLGSADALSFSVHWRPSDEPIPSAVSGFPKTAAGQWNSRGFELSDESFDAPVSRRPGVVWFQWVDRTEGAGATSYQGEGATIDDVRLSGWKYGPVRSIAASASHTAVRIRWDKPPAAVGSSIEETRPIVYDVFRRVGTGSWTGVALGIGELECTAAGLTPGVGYTFAVQARDTAPSPSTGYGRHQSVVATTTNSAPVPTSDGYTATRDVLLSVPAPGVLGNDIDPDGDPMTVTLVGQPTRGSVIMQPSGAFTYAPAPGTTGLDTFTYRAADGFGGTATATVSISVVAPVEPPVGEPPVTVAGHMTVDEDSLLAGTASAYVTDPDTDDLSYWIVSHPAHGDLIGEMSTQGGFVYRPHDDYHGEDSFIYAVYDGSSTAYGTIGIEILPINDPPTAEPAQYLVSQATTLTVSAPGVRAHAADIDGDPLTASAETQPVNGMLAMSPDGGFSYAPTPGFHGTDQFVYRVSDGSLAATAAVTITVQKSGTVVRIAGSDRYVVAAGLARKSWDPDGAKSWPGVEHVIVANGEPGKEADPLAAAGLAGAYDAPVLLAQVTRIPSATRTVIREIAAARAAEGKTLSIHLIGGTASLPDARWSDLRAIPGVSAVKDRIAGSDRYAVSANIASRIVQLKGADAIQGVIIVAGDASAAFFDALAASPAAYRNTMPMLSVRKTTVPSSVQRVLTGVLAGKPRYAASGSTYLGAVPTAGATRLATSSDRYLAATQIAERLVAGSLATNSDLGLCSALPDALTGGTFIGRQGGVMLFTDKGTVLRPATAQYIADHSDEVSFGWVFGGTASVRAEQEAAFATLVK